MLDSELELKELPFMTALGITRCETMLPMTFIDPAGQPFHRCADWLINRRRWSCYVETKAYLNNQPDRATADEAKRNPVHGRKWQWHIAETSWSNSIANNAIVHHQYGPDNIIIALPDSIFKLGGPKSKRPGKLPIATVTTLNRLKAADVRWFKTSELPGYMRVRDLSEAWQAQHTPQPQQPPQPGDTVNVWCKTTEHMAYHMDELKAAGYRLKRGSKTATSCTMCFPK